ncbi:MAG: hypothetical protein KDI79_05085 [Anaerolineae bacterium]|nr:hypothetical protein [Anaerolineae bacterium]
MNTGRVTLKAVGGDTFWKSMRLQKFWRSVRSLGGGPKYQEGEWNVIEGVVQGRALAAGQEYQFIG